MTATALVSHSQFTVAAGAETFVSTGSMMSPPAVEMRGAVVAWDREDKSNCHTGVGRHHLHGGERQVTEGLNDDQTVLSKE